MSLRSNIRRARSLQVPALFATVLLAALAGGAALASAAQASPAWAIRSSAAPSNFSLTQNEHCESEERCDTYVITATNVGTEATTEPSVITDELPSDIVVKEFYYEEHDEGGKTQESGFSCTGGSAGSTVLKCSYAHPVPPGGIIEITLQVTLESGVAGTVTNHVSIESAGVPTAVSSDPTTVPNTVDGTPVPPFGVQAFGVTALSTSGTPDVQAGDHLGSLTTTITYPTEVGSQSLEFASLPVAEPKTEIVDLPLGFVGDPLAAAQCPESTLRGTNEGERHCPSSSRVGTATIETASPTERDQLVNIYNVVPEADFPAEFGFEFDGTVALLRARVLPSASGYVLSVAVPDVPRTTQLKVSGVTLSFFGDPAEQSGQSGTSAAFFTNPSNCSAGPMKARLEMNSWVRPEEWVSKEATVFEADASQGVSGCNRLQFAPSLTVAPETTQVDTPSGYAVDLKIPQAANLAPVLATPPLKDIEVTLPEGVSVSPGAADGLVGCRESGPEGIELGANDTLSHDAQEGEEIGPDGLPQAAPGHCPAASQIGEVEVTTPVLANPLHGYVFLAQPKCGAEGQPECTEASATNGELFGLYLEAAGSGVIVKLEGKVEANPQTGRLTTTFVNNPQLPFSELKLSLDGGARAPLSNPQACGEARTTGSLTPWSAPESGAAASTLSSFSVTGCASPQPFAPGFLAHASSTQAGGFSPFTLTLSRQDGQQDLSGLTLLTPPGLLGMLSPVQRCAEPQAAAGTCGEASLIGHVEVAAGSGSHPFWTQGRVYLTNAYKGGPFGLSIVTPTKAGPFNLGNVIVRAAIYVDPFTSALTVVSDPFPRIVDGVPLRIQTINVTIDRPGFMFNPTNCSQLAVTATAAGALPDGSPGASVPVSVPFTASGCKGLPFKPGFGAATLAKTSKAKGASLHVNVTSAPGQANIAKVKVSLPKQLPSRLTTLQKACLAAVFDANPANCPAASLVGKAKARTPVLSSMLIGPAYLVSHGGEKFPDLVVVLQGEGITLELVGNTDIKKGITTSTFNTVPDAPVSRFELELPEGPYSVLSPYLPTKAKYSMCGQTLAMPTTITGQNGAVVTQTTKMSVSGCPKPHKKKAKKAKKPGKKHAAKK